MHAEAEHHDGRGLQQAEGLVVFSSISISDISVASSIISIVVISIVSISNY